MSEKKQNLNFVTPNKDQQKIFQDYLGKKLGTKALLVLEQEIEDKQTSYNFIYQYPDQLQLASFLIVLDSDERLVSLASNIVTDASSAYAINIQDFILEYVKKTLGKDTKELFETPYKNLEQNIPNTEKQLVKTVVDTVLEVLGKSEILEQIVRPKTSEISAGEAVDYSTKSQANYYFDCGNGNKGSFCCILQRLKYKEIEVTEKGVKVKKLEEIDDPTNVIPFDENTSNETLSGYYILTAGHNLQKGIGVKDYNIDKMKLIVEQDNFNGNTTNIQDSAILKITNFNESSDIISNSILFTSYNTPETGEDCHIVGYDKKDIVTKNGNVDNFNSIYKTQKDGFAGMSGGPVFKDENNLNGLYLGTEGVLKYGEIIGIENYKLYTV